MICMLYIFPNNMYIIHITYNISIILYNYYQYIYMYIYIYM